MDDSVSQPDKQEIIEAALETACRLIQELTTKVASLEEKCEQMNNTIITLKHKVDEAHFNATADNDLFNYQHYWINQQNEHLPSANDVSRAAEELYQHRAQT
jgi:hypothetical protein